MRLNRFFLLVKIFSVHHVMKIGSCTAYIITTLDEFDVF